MSYFKLNEDSWPLFQTVGTWMVAVGLLIYEGVGRHFQDSGGITILGGLLGLPVIIGYERNRREGQQRDRDTPPDDRPPSKRKP